MTDALTPGSEWLLPVTIHNLRVSEDGNARSMRIEPIYMSEEGSTMLIPASRLADLEAEVARLNKALTYEENLTSRIGTHGPVCYMWGPNHYECLKAEVDRLREALAGWMIKNSYATGHGDTFDDLLSELDWQHAKRTNP